MGSFQNNIEIEKLKKAIANLDIDPEEITDLIIEVNNLKTKQGAATLTTSANTISGAINEINAKVTHDASASVAGTNPVYDARGGLVVTQQALSAIPDNGVVNKQQTNTSVGSWNSLINGDITFARNPMTGFVNLHASNLSSNAAISASLPGTKIITLPTNSRPAESITTTCVLGRENGFEIGILTILSSGEVHVKAMSNDVHTISFNVTYNKNSQ